MPSTPVLVLIALTVLACAFIVALLLRIRAHRLQVTPVFGNYGGIDRASNPMWRNRHVIDDDQEIVAGTYAPGAFNRYADRELSEAMRDPQREAKAEFAQPATLESERDPRNPNRRVLFPIEGGSK